MKNRKWLAPAFLLAGLAGAALKRVELGSVLDESGYAVAGAPLTAVCAAVALGGIVCAYLLALALLPSERVPKAELKALEAKARAEKRPEEELLDPLPAVSYAGAMPGGTMRLALSLVSAALVLAGGVMMPVFSALSGWFDLLLRALSVACGLSLAALGFASFGGEDGALVRPASLAAAVFPVLWMAELYRSYGAGYSLTAWAVELAGVGFAALALAAQAGFAFRSASPRFALRTSLAAIFLLAMAQGQALSLPARFLLAGLCLHLTITTYSALERHIAPELSEELKALRAAALEENPEEQNP
ncbi:MAG: hypothetical protein ACSW8F_04895 [bacterium]